MHFPNQEEVIRCPHCKGQCAYREAKVINWSHSHPGGGRNWMHYVRVLHCGTCGNPLIRHVISKTQAETEVNKVTIYPSGPPARDPAPDEIRNAKKELAVDYDEAVACEPHSLQAAAFLLGRCVERILVDKAGVNRGATLGVQINEAIEANKIPEHLKKSLKDGLLIARNQAGHVWQDAEGNDLPVDKDTVDDCFTIVDELFVHFYLAPLKTDAFTKKMNRVKVEKT